HYWPERADTEKSCDRQVEDLVYSKKAKKTGELARCLVPSIQSASTGCLFLWIQRGMNIRMK
ncbi:MAG: hypothetical protein LLF89_02440, partial [Spirochaetaceae bacterium]|nr:hypothetical protein [Spirochaetaceae bacterium]